ncbi:S-layer homology domain-containing protein [Ruminiclostridium josui]|uniref:S-layer homology domain-containing protein n=2 Tax=Ruminiclostridium josui TaxID=1499 RepID=UPI000467EA44|nr:S-layer homology domain-containing protein [Ruminiclostridium josui]
MYIRRKLSLVLALIICLLSFTQAFAVGNEDSMTTDEKATALNKISLLSGTNTGFNLDGYLTRAEATTFIVKLLGKAEYVNQEKDRLRVSHFPDVVQSAWYAPYVGYCSENGIIAGYPNGNFGPNDRLNEKAFLTMVLKAIGYSEFTGTEVYTKAYETGLVTDSSYLEKTDVNNEYKRGDVVELLYHTLSINPNDSQVSVLKTLISNGAIKIDAAILAGLLTEADKLEIAEIIPQSAMTLVVKFNKEIQKLTADDIKINTFGNDNEVLNASIVKQEGNTVTIKTALQVPQKNYFLRISNVSDMDDNIKLPYVEAAFPGYVQKEIISDFFKISSIKPVSKNSIIIYFTQPVNINAEDPTFYSIFDGDTEILKGSASTIAVKALDSQKNAVSLTLKGISLAPDKEYHIKVSGDLNSEYGVRLGEAEGDSGAFISINEDNVEFAVDKIYALNSKTIRIDFNKQVNPTRAQYIHNYGLTSQADYQIQITKAVVAPDVASNGKSVLLTINGGLDSTQEYKLMIFDLNDISRQQSITERLYSFSGKYTDSGVLNVTDVKVIDTGTLDVYFNRELDSESASINNNYTFIGITNTMYSSIPVKAYFDSQQPKKVRLFLGNDSQFKYRDSYKLVVQASLKDYMGNPVGTLIYVSFPCNTELKAVKPNISSAIIIAKDAVKLTFSREISLETPNILNSNYVLEYSDGINTVKKIPTSVNYINATTMILKFDKLDFNNRYTIRFTSLKDISGLFKSSGSEFNSVQVIMGSDK